MVIANNNINDSTPLYSRGGTPLAADQNLPPQKKSTSRKISPPHEMFRMKKGQTGNLEDSGQNIMPFKENSLQFVHRSQDSMSVDGRNNNDNGRIKNSNDRMMEIE